MGAINARNLPEFTGKDILIQSMEIAETILPDYRLNAEATFIIGLCIIIRDLRDRIEDMENPELIYRHSRNRKPKETNL